MKIKLLFVFLFVYLSMSYSQTLSNLDSMLQETKDAVQTLKKIKFTGYFQPQFQISESKGSKYPGGDFGAAVDKRFTLRRARFKMTYTSSPFQMVLNTENTEKSLAIHDVYISYTLEKIGLKYTAGLFPRPISFEQWYSTSLHEAPELARFSQVLLPAEADLGFKLSYLNLKPFLFEAGIFNGTSTLSADFDSYKDLIARVAIDQKINTSNISGEISFYQGGIIQSNNKLYKTQSASNVLQYVLQDTLANPKGASALRQYLGADIQYLFKNGLGETTLRAEWINGTQPGTTDLSSSPSSKTSPPVNTDTYSRKFNAFVATFLHKIGNTNLQLVLKYDWYDPNTDVKGEDIGVAGSRLNATDIKYTTFGFGLNYYFQNMYIMAYYDILTNEKAPHLAGYENDLKDNVFTIRTQIKF